jgi:hypothetical protein
MTARYDRSSARSRSAFVLMTFAWIECATSRAMAELGPCTTAAPTTFENARANGFPVFRGKRAPIGDDDGSRYDHVLSYLVHHAVPSPARRGRRETPRNRPRNTAFQANVVVHSGGHKPSMAFSGMSYFTVVLENPRSSARSPSLSATLRWLRRSPVK